MNGSIATADMLFCTIYLPITIIGWFIEEVTETFCTIIFIFYFGFCMASMMSLVAITINRYILLYHNGKYDKIYSTLNTIIMISMIWFFSFAVSISSIGTNLFYAMINYWKMLMTLYIVLVNWALILWLYFSEPSQTMTIIPR